MKIGFVGYGSMSKALAPRFRTAGHSVFLGGHNPDKAKAAAEEVNADGHGDTAAAVAFGEVVVLGTPHDKVFDAIDDAGGPSTFAGRVVVDINNPVAGWSTGDFANKTYDDGKSLAEAIADKLPEAEVCKAFNCCQAKVWEMDPPIINGQRLVTFTAANGDKARQVAADLVKAVGSDHIDLGDLTKSRNLEAIASVEIQLLFSGMDPRSVITLVRP
ncbi:MAG: NAD(P)-binding domain-containing protein [Planctomycetota bacterium]